MSVFSNEVYMILNIVMESVIEKRLVLFSLNTLNQQVNYGKIRVDTMLKLKAYSV